MCRSESLRYLAAERYYARLLKCAAGRRGGRGCVMNWVDWVILALLAMSVIGGVIRGLLTQVAMFVGAFLGLLVANTNYGSATDFLGSFFPKTGTLAAVAYLLVFVLVWLLVALGAQTVRTVLRASFLGCFDRAGGAVFGLVQGILFVEVLVSIGWRVHDPTLHTALHAARLFPVFHRALPDLHRLLPKHLYPPPR